ncbi:MAG: class I SAM-dependent methyltransferase [Promethearchaeota archaeon]
MARNYSYVKGEKDKKFIINSMRKYVDQPQEIDKFLMNLIEPKLKEPKLKILDACCGIGHLLYFLSDLSPQSSFLGVDKVPYLIEEARILNKKKRNVSFEIRDVYDLPLDYSKFFDISISWKTITWLPYYDEMVTTLIAITKKHIFISSLFYDGDIDFEIKIREFQKESGKKGFNAYYNVYSLPQFRKYVYNLGIKNLKVWDFEIGIDIPKPPPNQMGTYTVLLDNGRRLQISGAVVMSWKIIRLDL